MVNMKPVCDHRNYCRNDNKAYYIGQDHHFAHKPHRDHPHYMPKGFEKIKSKFDGVCSYTRNHGGHHRTLCQQSNGHHAWKHPETGMKLACASPDLTFAPFGASLESKHGVPKAMYVFQLVKATSSGGSFTDNYVKECAKINMKPLCDHRNYCRNDGRAMYIGQDHHIAHKPHRDHPHYMPKGFEKVKDRFNGACTYTERHGGHHQTLCQQSNGHHTWKRLQAGMKLACVQVEGAPFSVKLESKHGVKAQMWNFAIVKLKSGGGSFTDKFVEACKKINMKPLCDHRNYCRNDNKAYYIGQDHHFAHKPHRDHPH
jgi:hypothetical protein